MKKMTRGLSLLFGVGVLLFSSGCEQKKTIAMDQLPAPSRDLVQRYFSGQQVAYINQETDWFEKSYRLFFVSGDNLEFDGKGAWKELDCRQSELPAELVPAPVLAYAASNHPGLKLVKLDREGGRTELTLEGGLELTFDQAYKLIDMDH